MPSKHPLQQATIVGVYNTKQGRSLGAEGWTTESLLLDAVRGVMNDAGVMAKDIDGVIGGAGTLPAGQLARLMGIAPLSYSAQGIGVASIMEASKAIAAGDCHTVLIANAQAAAYSEKGSTAPWTRPTNEFVACWGLFTTAEFALVAQRHMDVYGTKPEALATVAAAIRNNGHRNPSAVYYGRGPFTAKDILESRMVASPYHLLDCAMTSEGGAAMIVTSPERARDLKQKPIYLLGGGAESYGTSYMHPPRYDQVGMVGDGPAKRAWAVSGLKPTDVDTCEFYDPFSWEIIRQFEAYGFCGKGEGGDFVMNGRTAIGGQFPVDTDGGLMSYSHAGTPQLLQRGIAGVLQLRGVCGDRQVKDAKVAMCTNLGAGAGGMVVTLLGTERP